MLLCYRLTFGPTECRHEFAAGDDVEAIEMAEDVVNGRAAQLWCASRLVARWLGIRQWMLMHAKDPATDQFIIAEHQSLVD